MIEEYFKNEAILKQVKRKELLSLQRKTFNLISKIKLKKLSVSIDADFKADEVKDWLEQTREFVNHIESIISKQTDG